MQILLDKILKLVEKDRRLQAQRIKDGDTFNVFSILGLQSYEVRTHSAFIGELLSPTGSHGCNDKLLAAFLKSVIIYKEAGAIVLLSSQDIFLPIFL